MHITSRPIAGLKESPLLPNTCSRVFPASDPVRGLPVALHSGDDHGRTYTDRSTQDENSETIYCLSTGGKLTLRQSG